MDAQIDRIKQMARILTQMEEAIANLDQQLSHYHSLQDDFELLTDYYGSDTWFADLADDERDLLPKDLNRGVLSEDGIYNCLIDNHHLAETMIEIGIEIVADKS